MVGLDYTCDFRKIPQGRFDDAWSGSPVKTFAYDSPLATSVVSVVITHS